MGIQGSAGIRASEAAVIRRTAATVLVAAVVVLAGLGGGECRGQSANWFVDSLGQANSLLTTLGPELRRHQSNPWVRDSATSLHRIEQEVTDLVARTRRGESYESVAAAYQTLDTHWRDASFRLRSHGEISPTVTAQLNRIDDVFRGIDRKLGLAPPIDRVRLRDLMIVTLTYMDAMFDDIRLSQGYSAQGEALLSQGRLLRERLRQESYRMDQADLDEIVSRFTDFVSAWRSYARSLHQLNDPHIHRRLESIRRQGEEVYATLRIQPAPDRNELLLVTQGLPGRLTQLADQVNRIGSGRLTRDQFRFVETGRALAERARRLANEVDRSGQSAAAKTIFREMDDIWNQGLRMMAGVDPRSGLQASLAQVNTHFNELRDLLGTGSWRGREEMLQAAAALEASAETFNIDIQRFRRLMEPVAFRDSIGKVSDEFYAAAKELHRRVGENADSRTLAASAERVTQKWNELTPLVNQVSGRGLAAPRAELIFTNYRELQPLVAQMRVMLVNQQ